MRRGSQTVRQRSAKSRKSVRLRSTPPFFCLFNFPRLIWTITSDALKIALFLIWVDDVGEWSPLQEKRSTFS